MLPGEETEEIELDPGEAAEELLARLLDAHRFGQAAAALKARLDAESGRRFRSAPPPASLRRTSFQDAGKVYDPRRLGEAIGELLKIPPAVDIRHIPVPKVTVAERLAYLRTLLRKGSFSFDDAVVEADRVTIAVTLFALLEMYKQGELTWTQDEPFGEITVDPLAPRQQAAPVAARGAA
jgi:segregation and condensation protein A